MAFRTIAKVTVAGSVRKPAFYLVLAVFSVLIFLSHFFTIFTLGQPTSMVPEVGISSIFICGILMSVFLGAQSLSGEIESGTIPNLLSKPITRASVLLAKFAGIILTSWLALAVLSMVFAVTLAIDGKPFSLLTAQALVLSFTAPLLAASSTLALSIVLPAPPAILISLCLFAFGSLSEYFMSFSAGFFRILLTALYAVLPDYGLINLTNRLSGIHPVSVWAFVWSLAYAVIYTAALMTLACLIFSKREIT